MIGRIEKIGKNLKLTAELPGGIRVIASPLKNFKGEWRWNCTIWPRSGRKGFSSQKECLKSAAKSLDITLV